MSFEIMKTAINLERSRTPKDNATSNSDFVVLKPISNDSRKVRKRNVRINPAQTN